ncbi:IclR family transcriptional regulator [Paraburkholderia phenoliruptrix]|uniref:IclR family transcriptional regulator n=1 Tax=Paraburkholderia phenoliruptrix TaxID=252970 RepID=UPI002869EB41|nr:IclR family transcriptional regulator [Paraburkholderia phenoliruptrix]WMY10895.1 IclR family transcriptional regulator [Paraburkholderia phenoliruptrix]
MVSTKRSEGDSSRLTGEVTTVQRALSLLKILGASDKPIGVNEMARRVGTHASAASRSLATLEHNGFVERDEETGRFRLGVELIALASKLLVESDVVRVARPYLEELAEATRETTSLSLWNKTEAINIEQVLGPGSIKHIAAPGRRNPAHSTATGKVFLAHMSEATLNEVLALGLEANTPKTITDPAALQRELLLVRERGYALAVGEFISEVVSMATVVRDRSGKVAAAIAVTMPAFHYTGDTEQRLAPFLMTAASTISKRLGYRDTD